MAVGGSTNAVLHLLAIAHAAEVDLSLDDFERIRERVPHFADLKPSGKYVATDLHRVGGIPLVMKMLLEAGLLHGECMTVTGKTVAENLKEVSNANPPATKMSSSLSTSPNTPRGTSPSYAATSHRTARVAKDQRAQVHQNYGSGSSLRI